MSRPPFMPWYVADYLEATIDLSLEQHGAYMLLLGLAWRRGGRLPNDMKWLRRAVEACSGEMHGHTFNRVVPPLIDRFFKLDSDGFIVSLRLQLEAQKANKRSANQKQNIDKRWAKYRENKQLADTVVLPAGARHKDKHINPLRSTIVGPNQRGSPGMQTISDSVSHLGRFGIVKDKP